MSQELLATEMSPPTILLIRGRAELDVVEGIPDEYLELSGAYQMTPDHLRTHRPAGSGHESDLADPARVLPGTAPSPRAAAQRARAGGIDRSRGVWHDQQELWSGGRTMADASRRILVVANRTAGTPQLLQAVRERPDESPCTFALLIPNEPRKGGADWTLETATPLLERAAGGPVQGVVGEADPFEAIKAALQEPPGFDEVIVSTLPKRVSEWLRRDLPHRVEKLGVKVTTVSQHEEATPSIMVPPARP